MYMNVNPPISAQKSTATAVLFLLAKVESRLKSLQAAREKRAGEFFGAACPERSEEVQYLSISATKDTNRT